MRWPWNTVRSYTGWTYTATSGSEPVFLWANGVRVQPVWDFRIVFVGPFTQPDFEPLGRC